MEQEAFLCRNFRLCPNDRTWLGARPTMGPPTSCLSLQFLMEHADINAPTPPTVNINSTRTKTKQNTKSVINSEDHGDTSPRLHGETHEKAMHEISTCSPLEAAKRQTKRESEIGKGKGGGGGNPRETD